MSGFDDSSRRGPPLSTRNLVSQRGYDDDDVGELPTSSGSSSNANLVSTRTGMNAGPRSSSDYLSRKTGEDLRLLNETLTRELEEKDQEIKRLEEETHKGVLQMKLQRALLDNKDLRKRLDEIRGFQTDTKTHLEDNAALLSELESVKGEMARTKTDYEQLIRSLQLENDQLKDDIHVLETKIGAYERETNELEEEIALGAREREAMRSEMNSLRNQLTALRSGGRVAELEEKLQNCTMLLHSKEVENDTLLKEMDHVTKENDELRALQTEHIQEVQVKHTAEQRRTLLTVEEKQQEIQMLKAEIATQQDRNKQLESMKIDHDAQVLELRNKMAEYEQGYNLTDAVAEIRQLKTQLKKQQLELNSEKDLINRRERELQRYVAENRNLKKLAGIEDENWGLNADELQLQNHIEMQKLQALHRTDQKIIKKLEGDRLELLDELRKGTTDRTQDGLIYLGLNAEKSALLEEYVERLRNDDPSLPQTDSSSHLQQKLDQQTKELETWKDRYARAQVEKDEMGSKLLALMERDKGMAYEQILQQITDLKVQYNMTHLSQSMPAPAILNAQGMPIIPETPSRHSRLLSPTRAAPAPPLPPNASAELRTVNDRVSGLPIADKHALFTRLYHEFQPGTQPQVEQQQLMAGSRLLSPRSQQRQLEVPAPGSTHAHAPKAFTFPSPAPANTAAAAPMSQDNSNAPFVQPMSVPFQPYAPTFDPASHASLSLDARDIANLDPATKSRLVGSLTELLSKERENNDLLDSLELYQIRFEKLSARQQMLYIEYNNARKAWAVEKEQLKLRVNNAVEAKEKVDLELARVKETEKNNADLNIDQELEQLRRRNLVLQTNEKVLARRYNSLEEQYEAQSVALTSIRKEFVDMEHTLKLRVVELNKRKKILETRNTNIQQLVSQWVPKEELFKIARKYNWMSNQYAELISKQDLNLIETNNVSETKRENENLKFRLKEVEEELKIQAERCTSLQEALAAVETTMIPNPDPTGSRAKKSLNQMMNQSLNKSSGSSGSTPATSTTQSIPSLLAELADLRARESSATKRCMRLDENLASINQHSLELEEELLIVRKKHHELSIAFAAEQEVVLELRNKSEGAVPYYKANQVQQQLLESNEKLVEAQQQIAHYKEIADLANHQAIQLLNLRPEDPKSEGYDNLVRDLQETIANMESAGDDARRMGKIARENMNLKLSIRKMEKEIVEIKSQQTKLQQNNALLEKELDIKNTDLYRLHNQARQTLTDKEKVILDLTSKNSITGNPNSLNHPMTLQQAETIHSATLKMQQQLEAQQAKSKEIQDQNDAYYLQVAELKIQLQQSQEMAALFPKSMEKSLKSSTSRSRAAAAPSSLALDEEDGDPALPASLSLTGATTAIDAGEYTLKLRQNLVKYSNELSKYKLIDVKSQHAITSMQSKLDFQANELHNYESQISKLQQELVEKDLYIQQKENDMKEQYMYLKEQETKLKLSESLKRMDAQKTNKRQQRNAVETLKKMQGTSDGKGLKLQNHIDEEAADTDPFAVHDDAGNDIDVDNVDINSLTNFHDEMESIEGGNAAPRMVEGVLMQLQSKLRLAKQVMVDQKEKIHDLEQDLERFKNLKTADENALNAAQEVSQMERARLLSTAQATIQNLNEQLASKNDRIEKYQAMLESAQQKYKQRKAQDEAEIERLNHALLEKNAANIGKVNTALTFLDEMPRLPKDVVSRVEMEDVMREKEQLINMLNKEVELLKVKCHDEQEARDMIDEEMKKLYASTQSEITSLKAEIAALQAAKQDDVKMNKLINKLRAEMSEKDEAVKKMEGAMEELKNSVLSGASDYRKMGAVSGESKEDAGSMEQSNDPEALKKQIATMEKKMKRLVDAVANEKKATREAQSALAQANELISAKEDQIRSTEEQTAKHKEDAERMRVSMLGAQNDASKQRELVQKHKKKSKEEVEELKKQHEKEKDLAERRAKLAAKMEGGGGEKMKELAASREIGRGSGAPSAAAASEESKQASSSAALASKAFSEWEAEKKSAKKLAALQARSQKQQAEIQMYQDSLDKTTKKLEKEQKEKLDLFNRFTALQQALQQSKQLSGSSISNLEMGSYMDDMGAAPVSDAELDKAMTKEALKAKLFEQQAANDALQRKIQVEFPQQLAVAREDTAEARRKAEQFLREKREAERALREANGGSILKSNRNKNSLSSGGDGVDSAALASLESQVSNAEQKVLELTLANLDLKYSAEHSGILVNRLRARLQEMSGLMKLIDGNYLAKEWKDMVPPEVKDYIDSLQEAGKAGDVTQSNKALTLILSTYRKIFEKLKTENENLKKNSQSSVEYMAVIKENKFLKKELAKKDSAAPPVKDSNKENKPAAAQPSATDVSQPSTSREPKEKDPTQVDRSELERAYSLHVLTRKELKKEQETNIKYKKKFVEMTKDLENAQAAIAEADKKLTAASNQSNLEWFRKEKNYLASIDDLTREKHAAEEEIKKLKVVLKEMKKQMTEMSNLIAHVRSQQAATQNQVLAAAQVQAAVLSKTETEAVKEQQLQAELQTMATERDRLSKENTALKTELSAFDAQFFEELEDLKYRYSQSVETVQQLNQQIQVLKAAAGKAV